MKIGVISDIHSNAIALQAVISSTNKQNVGGYACAGDIIGYYTMPNQSISILKDIDAVSVQGNHDAKAINPDINLPFNYYAERSLDWNRRKLTPKSAEYLKSLPSTIRYSVHDCDIFITHGSPKNPIDEYIRKSDITKSFLEYSFDDIPDILVLGHTHKPYVKHINDTIIINPGSVGQPRDGDPRASYGIIDLYEYTAYIKRVWYNIDEIAERTNEVLPRKLGDRLYEGR